jgi:hypothetical protein
MEWIMSNSRQESQPGLDQQQSSSELFAEPNSIRDSVPVMGANVRLPSLRTKHWVPHRKAEIVSAISNGHLSLDDALHRYGLTIDEYITWRRGLELFGLAGLRVSEIQRYRRTKKKQAAASSEAGEAVD